MMEEPINENKEARFQKTVYLFRKLFPIHSSYLVLFLWFLILLLSILKEMVNIPQSFFENKRNILNQIFVKWGWAWTLLLTGSYMILTSFVHGALQWKKAVFFSVARLAVATVIWYFWVNIVFHFVENITGICLDKNSKPNFNISDKYECIQMKRGHVWNGFDISGHCFLLTFSILVINSELQIHKRWNNIDVLASKFLLIGSKALLNVKKRYKSTFYLVNVLFILSCALMVLWVVMLSSTCLYFHTFYSKALGGSCGIMSWMVTYHEWFKHQLSPGLPGMGPLQGLLCKNCLKLD